VHEIVSAAAALAVFGLPILGWAAILWIAVEQARFSSWWVLARMKRGGVP
jgi:hypothetical protein